MKSRFFFIFALVSFMTPAMAMADDGTLGQTTNLDAESVLCQKYQVKMLRESKVYSAQAPRRAAGQTDDSVSAN